MHKSAPLPAVNIDRISLLSQQYQDLGTNMTVAAENGLFVGNGASHRAKIDAGIAAVESALAAGDAAKGEEELYKLQVDYYSAVASKGALWRLVNVYGVMHLLGSFIGAYVAFRIAALFFTWDGSPDLKALLAGIGGATLKGLYFTIDKCNKENLRRVWVVSSLIGPFVGLLLAIFVHYSFAGGLALISNHGGADSLNKDAIIWICLFAGLRWEWAIKLFDRVSSKFKQS